jgi:hypothetical protein
MICVPDEPANGHAGRVVDFVDPWIAGVSEIVVTGPHGSPISSLDDLSGQEVFVRESSRYYQSLLGLNARLTSAVKAPVKLTPAPEELEDEDVMEIANSSRASTRSDAISRSKVPRQQLLAAHGDERMWLRLKPEATMALSSESCF